MKRASVVDVAKAAGVSTATVSRVLNDPERVALATRERVLAAIRELNFVKSATAFSFKVRQTNNILVIVANIGSIYYSEVFEGLQRKAEEGGYSIIIASPPRASFSRDITDRLRSGRVDGVIVLDGREIDPSDFALLESIYHGTPPLVGFAEQRGRLNYPHVYIDNRSASAEVVRYLVEMGHTRIGHVAGPAGYTVTEERLAGVRAGMAEAGLDIPEHFIIRGGFRTLDGRHAARAFLGLADRPTALFCANDEAAMGLIAELSEAGISVPGDLSVVGFDDNSVAEAYVPSLTTVSQPRRQIGAATMSLLLQIMRDPGIESSRVAEVDLKLTVRKSVTGPKNR